MATITTTPYGVTSHNPADPIARAIMCMPAGGPRVELTIGRQRHSLHSWSLRTINGVDRLDAEWCRRDDLPTSVPPRAAWRALWRRLTTH